MLVLAAELEHEQGASGLLLGKILTLCLGNLFESSSCVRSFSAVLVLKRFRRGWSQETWGSRFLAICVMKAARILNQM